MCFELVGSIRIHHDNDVAFCVLDACAQRYAVARLGSMMSLQRFVSLTISMVPSVELLSTIMISLGYITYFVDCVDGRFYGSRFV